LIFKAVALDRQVLSHNPIFAPSRLPSILESELTLVFIVSRRAFDSAIHGENRDMEECLVVCGIAKKCGALELIRPDGVYVDLQLVSVSAHVLY